MATSVLIVSINTVIIQALRVAHPTLQAGAGPTGLTLALALLKNGVPVRIIDKMPEPRVGQKGNGLQVSSQYF